MINFDIVTASFVLDHVTELDKTVTEIKKVLKLKELFIFSISHPITYMFRNSEREKFIPSDTYFDNEIFDYNIAKLGLNFLGF